MAEIRAKLTLDDDFSAQIKKSIEGTDLFAQSIIKAKTQMKDLAAQRFEATIKAKDEATKKITEAKKAMESMKKNIAITIAAKDVASESINRIKGHLELLGAKTFSPIIRVKDEASSTIKTLSDKLINLKTMAAAVAASFAFNNTIGSASRLEQEEVAMKHFISNNNSKASESKVQGITDKFIEQLRVNANVTPFGTNEVLAAGRRAVNIQNGDTTKSMNLVNLAENMSALNPGKSVMDAMEALADLKTGEFERMKEFGFKFSAAQFNGLVGKGQNDTLTDAEMNKAYDMTVKNKLNPVFAGGAKELSNTTAGQWSTVTGNLETIGTNFGKAFLPVINTVLTPLASLLDKNSDKFTKFGQSTIKAGSVVKTALNPAFIFISQVSQKYLIPAFNSVVKVIQKYAPSISGFFVQMWNNISPSLQKLWGVIQNNIIPVIRGLWGIVQKLLPPIGKMIQVAFEIGVESIKISIDIFSKIADVISWVWDKISPILGWIADKFNTVADAIKSAFDWLTNWNDTSAKDKGDLKGLQKLLPQGAVKTTTNTKKNNKTSNIIDFVLKNPIGGNALGTTYWKGGPTWLFEHGAELVNLPAGSKVYNNRQTSNMLNTSKNMMLPNMDSASWGKDIPEGMAKGIKGNIKPVTDSVTLMANKIKELIHFTAPDKGPLADFNSYPVDMLKTFGTGITNNTKLVTTPTTNMSGNVKGIFSNLTVQSLNYGQQVVGQFGAGMRSAESNAVGIAHELVQKVIEAFTGPEGFDIHSPSKKMTWVGGNTIQGLINGISSKDVLAFFKNKIGAMVDFAQGASGQISGWLTAALGITGTPMSWLPGLLQLVRRESGGNPAAYNGISVGGEHATGLLQMLASTFRENMLPGLTNILNPIANTASAIRYIKKHYGNVMNIPNLFNGNYKGYAVGLTRVPYDNFPAVLHEDERVLTANEARNYNNKNNKASIIIQKLADKIEVRNDKDIDTIIDKLYDRLMRTAENMA